MYMTITLLDKIVVLLLNNTSGADPAFIVKSHCVLHAYTKEEICVRLHFKRHNRVYLAAVAGFREHLETVSLTKCLSMMLVSYLATKTLRGDNYALPLS